MKKTLPNAVRPRGNVSLPDIKLFDGTQPIPERDVDGNLHFLDHPHFRPNLTPAQILSLGSFGGTYFQPIYSSVTGLHYKDIWKELPSSWLDGLTLNYYGSSKYDKNINKYKVSCGQTLEEWEEKGWILAVDPYGWFMWYCRFYQGRRSTDDSRQLKRGLAVFGPKGRWLRNLVNKCKATGRPKEETWNDHTISPVIRQLLQHWGWTLTIRDLE